MINQISVYDKENFFELYQKLRSNPISLNEVVEKPTMLSLLPDLQGKKLLDLGCGAGEHLALYLSRGARHVVGIDLSANMLKQAKIDLEKINTIIDEIPEYANGLLIISNDRKTLYKKILADRATIIEKSYNLILNKENKLNNSIKISLSKPKERGGLEQ